MKGTLSRTLSELVENNTFGGVLGDVAADCGDLRFGGFRSRPAAQAGSKSGLLRFAGVVKELHVLAQGPARRAGRAAVNARRAHAIHELIVVIPVAALHRFPKDIVCLLCRHGVRVTATRVLAHSEPCSQTESVLT